jgi:hypothetical protein
MANRPDLDGLLIHLPGDSTLYLVDQGQARAFPNDKVFIEWTFVERAKVWPLSIDIDKGPAIIRDGGLAMGTSETKIYWYDAPNSVRHIVDPQTFARYSFNSKWIQPPIVPSEPTQTGEVKWVPLYNGNRIKVPSAPEIYLIDQGKRRHILDMGTFTHVFGDVPPQSIDSVKGIPAGPDISPGARLIKGDGGPEVYFYELLGGKVGMKRHVLSSNAMSYYGFVAGQIDGWPQAMVDAVQVGTPIDWPDSPP